MSTVHACVALFVLCIGYNWLIGRVIQRTPHHGLTALWVVGGVLLVLGMGALINDAKPQYFYWSGAAIPLSNGQLAAWLFLKLFACAGVPMVLGSLWRYLHTL